MGNFFRWALSSAFTFGLLPGGSRRARIWLILDLTRSRYPDSENQYTLDGSLWWRYLCFECQNLSVGLNSPVPTLCNIFPMLAFNPLCQWAPTLELYIMYFLKPFWLTYIYHTTEPHVWIHFYLRSPNFIWFSFYLHPHFHFVFWALHFALPRVNKKKPKEDIQLHFLLWCHFYFVFHSIPTSFLLGCPFPYDCWHTWKVLCDFQKPLPSNVVSLHFTLEPNPSVATHFFHENLKSIAK